MLLRSQAPVVVAGSFAALVGLICALPGAAPIGGPAGLVLLLGLVISAAWTFRLSQWLVALLARPRPAEVHLLLAHARRESERGGFTLAMERWSAAQGRNISPTGYSVWARVRYGDGTIRLQRVVWEPWLSGSPGHFTARVRHGWAGGSIIDLAGAGRLWPASWTLRRQPFAVRLSAWHTGPLLSGDKATPPRRVWRVFAIVVVGCAAFPAFDGNWAAAAWIACYATAVGVAGWCWFGLTPPGWEPS